MDVITLELAKKTGTVLKNEAALAMLEAATKFTFVFAAIVPYFQALSLLQVMHPRAHIIGPIRMCVCAGSMCTVSMPFTFVDVAIRMFKMSKTMHCPAQPLTFEQAPSGQTCIPSPQRSSLLQVPVYTEPSAKVYAGRAFSSPAARGA
eukprot:CAMPEP_0172904744 /NCGR_PEP_ID=MMETSP1075-20121228/173225_1 /TAXON_ID=2916 /ORGANISM="Ceratium fusus, Strain PA161109" /LENGTH=147 /DNA_ID=CAMNT_0013761843 /DNA_START=414 /DNA_END=858 /DNA_ORIENTATION=-